MKQLYARIKAMRVISVVGLVICVAVFGAGLYKFFTLLTKPNLSSSDTNTMTVMAVAVGVSGLLGVLFAVLSVRSSRITAALKRIEDRGRFGELSDIKTNSYDLPRLKIAVGQSAMLLKKRYVVFYDDITHVYKRIVQYYTNGVIHSHDSDFLCFHDGSTYDLKKDPAVSIGYGDDAEIDMLMDLLMKKNSSITIGRP